ncbi:MAG: glycosyltransferase family 2 protein [Clostridia bacterium]|nr:glycosyltransferase family 2 protein [Clostridia bacterium]
MPKISIIIPIYNAEQYITSCINGILNQTFSDFELILVDDGSKDSSGEICDEFAKSDDRIRVIHKKNGGAADARNCGIDIAVGEWIMFFDSDDCFEPNIVQKLYETVQAENADMAVCSIDLFNEDCFEDKYIPDHFIATPGIFSGAEILSNGHIPTVFVSPCCKIFKKSLFENLRYKTGRICEDEMIVHHILYRCKKIVVINDILYHYRQLVNSVSHTVSPKKLDTVYAFYDRFLFYKKMGIANSDIVLKDYFWNLDNYYFKVKENDESTPRFKECRKNTRKLIFYYLRIEDVSVKEKLLKLLFCISPSMYKSITNK